MTDTSTDRLIHPRDDNVAASVDPATFKGSRVPKKLDEARSALRKTLAFELGVGSSATVIAVTQVIEDFVEAKIDAELCHALEEASNA